VIRTKVKEGIAGTVVALLVGLFLGVGLVLDRVRVRIWVLVVGYCRGFM